MTSGDGVLILIVILLSFIPALLQPLAEDPMDPGMAVIQVDGQSVSTLNMKTPGIYEFPFEQGTGIVEISNQGIRMLEMDRRICPEAICSDKGWIETSAEAIICLPNRIVVTLQKSSGDYDLTAKH